LQSWNCTRKEHHCNCNIAMILSAQGLTARCWYKLKCALVTINPMQFLSLRRSMTMCGNKGWGGEGVRRVSNTLAAHFLCFKRVRRTENPLQRVWGEPQARGRQPEGQQHQKLQQILRTHPAGGSPRGTSLCMTHHVTTDRICRRTDRKCTSQKLESAAGLADPASVTITGCRNRCTPNFCRIKIISNTGTCGFAGQRRGPTVTIRCQACGAEEGVCPQDTDGSEQRHVRYNFQPTFCSQELQEIDFYCKCRQFVVDTLQPPEADWQGRPGFSFEVANVRFLRDFPQRKSQVSK